MKVQEFFELSNIRLYEIVDTCTGVTLESTYDCKIDRALGNKEVKRLDFHASTFSGEPFVRIYV